MRDYAEIEAYIAEARRLRSEAVGEYLAAGARALKRGMIALIVAIARHGSKPKGRNGTPPYLPA